MGRIIYFFDHSLLSFAYTANGDEAHIIWVVALEITVTVTKNFITNPFPLPQPEVPENSSWIFS